MRYAYYLISSIFLLPLTAQSQLERINIVVKKNALVSLAHIVEPITSDSHKQPTFYLNRLILKEGATLYVDRHAAIDARTVVLSPRSKIHTLGHNLDLKTEVFKAVHFDPERIDWDIDKRKDYMGTIDTRHRDELHRGKKGESKVSVMAADPQKTGHAALRTMAQEGQKGKAGTAGAKGQSAGALFLETKRFLGGHFITSGGQGGQGEDGIKGQKGGNGFSSNGPSELPRHHSHDSLRPFLAGAQGGPGGEGSDGGPGGDGGNIKIHCEKDDSKDKLTLFAYNSAGQGGLGGAPGKGGPGGDRGLLLYNVWVGGRSGGKESHGSGTVGGRKETRSLSHVSDGPKGIDSIIPGASGADGNGGSFSIKEDKAYYESR